MMIKKQQTNHTTVKARELVFTERFFSTRTYLFNLIRFCDLSSHCPNPCSAYQSGEEKRNH